MRRLVASRSVHRAISALVLILVQSASAPAADCNSNGTEDTEDIESGFSEDCNEDGTPDNPLVTQALSDRDAFMFLTVDEEELERTEPWESFEPEGFRLGQFQHAEETLPGGGRFDATIEEVLHLVSMGYVEAYPTVYGPRNGTRLAECLDRARGGHFSRVPRSYPEGAWFTYDDRTCDYGCQCIEYLYWAVTSLMGAQADPERCREIRHEWRPCTAAELRETDPEIVELITDERWAMPSRLPDGRYAPTDDPG